MRRGTPGIPWFILVVALSSAHADAQANLLDKARRSYQFAEFMVERGKVEDAAIAAREAYRTIEALTVDQRRQPEAKNLRKQTIALLGKIDPDGRRVIDAERRQAVQMLRLSKSYRAKGWHKTALGILERAAHLAPNLVAKELQDVRKKLGLLGKKPERHALQEWFENGFTAYSNHRWTFSTGGVASPVVEKRQTEMIVSRKKLRGDVKVMFDVRIPTTGFAGFSWNVSDPKRGALRQYLFEVYPRERVCMLRRLDGKTVKELGTCRMTNFKALGWIPVKLEFRGKSCIAAAGDMRDPIHLEMAAPLGGFIGLFVSGANELKDPVMYRRLVIEPLR